MREIATQVPSLAAVAAFDRRGATLRRGDERELLLLTAVSANYFEALGVPAALGRVIGKGADQGLPSPAVVVSDRLWRARFGADPALVPSTGWPRARSATTRWVQATWKPSAPASRPDASSTRGSTSSTSRVVVVSEAFARAFLGQTPAVGRHVRVSGEDHEIVGVVEDAPVVRLHEPEEPFVYLPYARLPSSDVALLVETAGEPAALAPAARALVREAGSGAEVLATTTLGRHMAEARHDD